MGGSGSSSKMARELKGKSRPLAIIRLRLFRVLVNTPICRNYCRIRQIPCQFLIQSRQGVFLPLWGGKPARQRVSREISRDSRFRQIVCLHGLCRIFTPFLKGNIMRISGLPSPIRCGVFGDPPVARAFSQPAIPVYMPLWKERRASF